MRTVWLVALVPVLLLGCNDRDGSVRFKVKPAEPITLEINGEVVATETIPPLTVDQLATMKTHSYRVEAEGYLPVTSTFVIDGAKTEEITVNLVKPTSTKSEKSKAASKPVATCKGMCTHALHCVIENNNGSESQLRHTQQYKEAHSNCVYNCRSMSLEKVACWTAAPCSEIESEQLLADQDCPGMQASTTENENGR
ncbi:MAG: hypothetical protein RBU30_16040 [Polyangia bacterium]|nr:hypothetical protein [Polyangia bacterium]